MHETCPTACLWHPFLREICAYADFGKESFGWHLIAVRERCSDEGAECLWRDVLNLTVRGVPEWYIAKKFCYVVTAIFNFIVSISITISFATSTISCGARKRRPAIIFSATTRGSIPFSAFELLIVLRARSA
jgi:hypothetical protein